MKSKMNRLLSFLIVTALVLPLFASGGAFAAGSIHVNDGTSVLGGDLNSAYVIGGNGEVSPAGGIYAVTGNGEVVKVDGGTPTGEVPSGEPDGSTVKVSKQIAKVGLYYYYNNARDTALASANLENKAGSGYKFGYYDSNRVFHELGSTAERKITMTPNVGSSNSRSVIVTATGTTNTLFVFDMNTGVNLAVRPVNNSGKAETWFKGYAYFGDFEYYRHISDRMTVINVVDLEDYIKGILPYEMSASWPLEALKAQAVAARSYFAANSGSYGNYGFDVTADAYSQVYYGTQRATAATDAAVEATRGEYITYNGAVASALYFSSDGGATEDSENIFVSALGHLRGKPDPYEADVPISQNSYKTWTRRFTGADLQSKLSSRGYRGGAVTRLVPEYSSMGNVIRLTAYDAGGASITVSKSDCYAALGLPSVRYTISQSADGSFVLEGSGWGHNVGMSQWGAYSMAKNYNWNYRQILRFYYTGIKISKAV